MFRPQIYRAPLATKPADTKSAAKPAPLATKPAGTKSAAKPTFSISQEKQGLFIKQNQIKYFVLNATSYPREHRAVALMDTARPESEIILFNPFSSFLQDKWMSFQSAIKGKTEREILVATAKCVRKLLGGEHPVKDTEKRNALLAAWKCPIDKQGTLRSILPIEEYIKNQNLADESAYVFLAAYFLNKLVLNGSLKGNVHIHVEQNAQGNRYWMTYQPYDRKRQDAFIVDPLLNHKDAVFSILCSTEAPGYKKNGKSVFEASKRALLISQFSSITDEVEKQKFVKKLLASLQKEDASHILLHEDILIHQSIDSLRLLKEDLENKKYSDKKNVEKLKKKVQFFGRIVELLQAKESDRSFLLNQASMDDVIAVQSYLEELEKYPKIAYKNDFPKLLENIRLVLITKKNFLYQYHDINASYRNQFIYGLLKETPEAAKEILKNQRPKDFAAIQEDLSAAGARYKEFAPDKYNLLLFYVNQVAKPSDYLTENIHFFSAPFNNKFLFDAWVKTLNEAERANLSQITKKIFSAFDDDVNSPKFQEYQIALLSWEYPENRFLLIQLIQKNPILAKEFASSLFQEEKVKLLIKSWNTFFNLNDEKLRALGFLQKNAEFFANVNFFVHDHYVCFDTKQKLKLLKKQVLDALGKEKDREQFINILAEIAPVLSITREKELAIDNLKTFLNKHPALVKVLTSFESINTNNDLLVEANEKLKLTLTQARKKMREEDIRIIRKEIIVYLRQLNNEISQIINKRDLPFLRDALRQYKERDGKIIGFNNFIKDLNAGNLNVGFINQIRDKIEKIPNDLKVKMLKYQHACQLFEMLSNKHELPADRLIKAANYVMQPEVRNQLGKENFWSWLLRVLHIRESRCRGGKLIGFFHNTAPKILHEAAIARSRQIKHF